MARHIWAGLDGLRGIAVLAVLVFHASIGWSVNGYVGVDIFFCLSGFLITWLLLEEHSHSGRVDLRAFYVRRVLRLYPALVAAILGVLALGVAVGDPGRVAPGGVAALFYLANWWLYTGHHALLLEHTWTLSLEEHFYFVWPLLLTLIVARSRRWRTVGALGIVTLLVALLVPWSESIDAVRGSYLRGMPIVWGCLLALALHARRPGRPARLLASVAALPAIVVLLVVLAVPHRLPEVWLTGLRSIPGVLSVVVVSGVILAPRSWTARCLSWSPLTWMGRRSYGLYLYHFVILSVFLHQVPYPASETVRGLAGMAVSILVAAASYRWLEKPFLQLKDRIADRSVPTLVARDPAPGIRGPHP